MTTRFKTTNRSDSPQDLNDIALANLRELIGMDEVLLPEWKANLAMILESDIPPDISVLERLVALEQRNDSTKKT